MADINVQIKQRNGAIWDNLFPRTKAELVDTTPEKQFVSETEKTSWNNKQSALGFVPENSANKNKANGYVGLDTNSKVPQSYLPDITITDTFVVASQTAMLALTAQTGDVAVRTDLNKTFILKTNNPTVLANWQELLSPQSSVISVNGKTGAVNITKSDIGLPNGINIKVSIDEPTTFTNGDMWLSIIE